MPDAPPQVADEDAIVTGVRDGDPIATIGRDLARKRQHVRAASGDRRKGGSDREVVAAREQLSDETAERLTIAFARCRRDHVSVRVDDDERGPGAHAVLLPCLQLRIVEHRDA